jgi:Mg-chelatase subunit ChlD
MAKKEAVEIVVIADRSGSMSVIRDDAIGGFNTFLKEQKAVKGAANLTLVLFDHEYLVAVDSQPIKKVVPLNNETYVPRGMTALNDSIGRAISALEAKNPNKAIVCILTDGQENQSREFNTEQAKAKINAAES